MLVRTMFSLVYRDWVLKVCRRRRHFLSSLSLSGHMFNQKCQSTTSLSTQANSYIYHTREPERERVERASSENWIPGGTWHFERGAPLNSARDIRQAWIPPTHVFSFLTRKRKCVSLEFPLIVNEEKTNTIFQPATEMSSPQWERNLSPRCVEKEKFLEFLSHSSHIVVLAGAFLSLRGHRKASNFEPSLFFAVG